MDQATLDAYDRDPNGFADDWDDIGCGSGRDAAWLDRNGYKRSGEGWALLCAQTHAESCGIFLVMDDMPRSSWTVQLFTSLAEGKAEEYRYWRSRPVRERLAAGADLSARGYAFKDPTSTISRLRTVAVKFQR